MGTSPSKKSKPRSAAWLIPLIIFMVALSVRIVGLDFSFPLLTHHDESYLMDALKEMSVNKSLDSGLYGYPSFISFYSKYFLLNMLSFLKFGANYGVTYSKDLNYFYYYARLLTAIQGALIPVVAWMIGKQYKRINFSLPAAILFTFYPPFVLHSHYVTVDMPLTLYVMLVLLFCQNYLTTKKKLWLILGCLMVAVSTMEKFPGVLAYGIVLVTVGIRALAIDEDKKSFSWGFFFKKVAFTLVLTIVFMILIGPLLFMHIDIAWSQVYPETRLTHLGADGFGWGGNLMFYLREFKNNAGQVVSIFALIGIGAAIFQKDPKFLLLFFGFGYWIALSKLGLHWDRWSLPMMISPLLLASLAIAKLWKALSSKISFQRLATIGLVVLAVIYALNGFTSSVVLSWPDTRVEALNYLNQNGITPENSISEGYTPFFSRVYKTIFDFDYQNPGDKHYVILSSNMYNRYAAEPERYSVENAFYAGVREKAVLIKQVVSIKKPTNPTDQLQIVIDYFQNLLRGTESTYRMGPIIQIYQLPQ